MQLGMFSGYQSTRNQLTKRSPKVQRVQSLSTEMNSSWDDCQGVSAASGYPLISGGMHLGVDTCHAYNGGRSRGMHYEL